MPAVSYCAFISGMSFGEWPTNASDPTAITPQDQARKPDTGAALSLFLDWISGEGGGEHVGELVILSLLCSNSSRIVNWRSG